MNVLPCLTPRSNAAWLAIKLQPRASRTELVGIQGDALRVRVTAPPVDAAANRALLEFLADILDCPRHQLDLIRGATSRHKWIEVRGLTLEELDARLRQALE